MHHSLNGYLAEVERGYIRMVRSGDGLVLFNYTDACTFDKAWNEYTLTARGIIFEEETGAIVARPFDKFFNYSEHAGIYGEDVLAALTKEPHYIQEKLDGSLGIVYWWNGSWRVATRGSFTSDQAIKGQELLAKYLTYNFHEESTYLVEIIYPENKIIVPYGDQEKLVLLAVRNNEQGTYASQLPIKMLSNLSGIDYASLVRMDIETALAKQKTLPYTEEGWVVVFQDGRRLKIKGDDYMRIAKFKANLSPLAVWESMLLGSYPEFERACPEEILGEMQAIHSEIDAAYTILWRCIRSRFVKIVNEAPDQERKTLALAIQKEPKWAQGGLFTILANGELKPEYVLKLLRPKGNELVTAAEVMG